MRIALFGKAIATENDSYLRQLIQLLLDRGVDVLVYEPFSQYIPKGFVLERFSKTDELKGRTDLMLSIGGDGTILDAVPLLRDSGIPVLGINMGRLGFISSVARDEIGEAVEQLLHGRYTTERRTLLELVAPQGVFNDTVNYALNDGFKCFRTNVEALGTANRIDIECPGFRWIVFFIGSTYLMKNRE